MFFSKDYDINKKCYTRDWYLINPLITLDPSRLLGNLKISDKFDSFSGKRENAVEIVFNII